MVSLNETMFQKMLDSINVGVYAVSREWKVIYFNRAAELITGFHKDEVIGKFCFSIFKCGAEENKHHCLLERTIQTDSNLVNLSAKIRCKDGSYKPVSYTTALLNSPTNKMLGGIVSFIDLSVIEEESNKKIPKSHRFGIIGKNHRMEELFKILPQIAESESTVLIQGDSGTGKELFAKAIHNLSGRGDHPFISINCGALPDTLLESELFGYKKGAFTDAKKDKLGRFALAEGGTIFLDEIGDISPAFQVKLLRVLQEREYEPLGATEKVKSNVRIITATHRNLMDMVSSGRFRDDLYYRLNVVKIHIPPLRERRDDIPLLVRHFIDHFNRVKSKAIYGLSDDSMDLLLNYDFPGNVRELENIIEHAFVLCKEGLIMPQHLPREILNYARPKPELGEQMAKSYLKESEVDLIVQTLERFDGHRGKTANALGMDKSTLWRKMKKYGLL